MTSAFVNWNNVMAIIIFIGLSFLIIIGLIYFAYKNLRNPKTDDAG